MTEFLHTFHCGHTTKCEYIKPQSQKTQSFTVVYAHGFCSDPYGRKPEETKAWCLEHGMGFFRYEIAGHGVDLARFEETTMDIYRQQIFEIVEEIVEGKIVVVGSSLGGWLTLLAACQYPEKVIGFVGLAAAPDFLKTYFINHLNSDFKAKLKKFGKIEFPTKDFTYVITQKMIDSAEGNLLLDKEVIPFNGKVCLLQGMNDASLEWHTVLTIAEKIQSDDVKVYLLKNVNHRLGTDEAINTLKDALDKMLTNG